MGHKSNAATAYSTASELGNIPIKIKIYRKKGRGGY